MIHSVWKAARQLEHLFDLMYPFSIAYLKTEQVAHLFATAA
jgi:hypothetical protein